jgi:hypothetical protein
MGGLIQPKNVMMEIPSAETGVPSTGQ